MEQNRGTGLAIGIIMVLLGIWFLAVQFIPGLQYWIDSRTAWPLFVVTAGILLLLIGLTTSARETVIPGCVVTGIGLILYWQNLTDRWGTWTYIWTLIPGLAGIGTFLAGWLNGRPGEVRSGIRLIVISAVMFVVFGAFFGALGFLGVYWPIVLIALGVLVLLNSRWRWW